MDLINKDFCNSYPNKFLTENVSLFLYSLIRCSRPQSILEIGAGYSTSFICKAIQDVQTENLSFLSEDQLSENNLNYCGSKYNPRFDVIENFYTEEYYNSIISNLKNLGGIQRYINFIDEQVDTYIQQTSNTYDMIWVDVGDGQNYMYFFKICMRILNDGGYLIFHSTMTNMAGRLFVSELKLMMKEINGIEIMSVVEPHKKVQCSFTIIKKTCDYPMYSVFA